MNKSSISYYIVLVFWSLLFSCKNDAPTKKADTSSQTIEVGQIIALTIPESVDTIKKSIKAYIKNNIGVAQFTIQYHSPAVKGRVIWGGLVPMDQVWVTGGHRATSIECDLPFTIGAKSLPAGKYALFTIPGKEKWTLIINKKWDQHLTDEYSEQDDLIRIELIPQASKHQERLRYDIQSTVEKSGLILFQWEKLSWQLPISIS